MSIHCANSNCNYVLAACIFTGIAHQWLASFLEVSRRHVASHSFDCSQLASSIDSCGNRSSFRIISNTESGKTQTANATVMCEHARVLVNVHERCYKCFPMLASAYVCCGRMCSCSYKGRGDL